MRDAVQPRRKSRGVVQLPQVLVSLQEHILCQVERILAVRNQPVEIVENALFPTGNQKIEGVHATAARLGD